MISIFLFGCSIRHEPTLNRIPCKLILDDEFKKFNRASWFWRTDGNGVQSITTDGVKLNLPPSKHSSSYNNSELYNQNYPYLKTFAQIRLKNSNIGKGSRGWGFWNGEMDRSKSEMAWFIKIDGYKNPKRNGLFAVTQRINEKTIKTPIKNISLEEWHIFSIDWRSNFVRFWVDNIIVAEHRIAIPSSPLRFDVWVDNAIYENRQKIFKNIIKTTSIQIDNLRIYKLNEAYLPNASNLCK